MDKNDAIEFLKKTVEISGIAISTVSDGTLIMMSEQKLKEFVKISEGKGNILIFLKSEPDPSEVN